MPRFILERIYAQMSDDEMKDLGARSKQTAAEQFPDITWEHSHVVRDESGALKSFCVYEGPSAERLLEHAEAFGGHRVHKVHEILEDVRPEDIASAAG